MDSKQEMVAYSVRELLGELQPDFNMNSTINRNYMDLPVHNQGGGERPL